MSHNAILKWIGQLVNVPEGATIRDLSDGRILTNLLNKLNPELYPQKIQSSPQKNFQMDMLCISNLVQNLKNAIPNFPEINCLLIAKHQDLTEILKLLAIIIKIMIESNAAQEAILKLSEDQVQNILQFINQYQEDDNNNIQQSDRRLLDKIDELEEENQKLKQILEQYDQQLQQTNSKLKYQEQYINQKESEITELKQQIQKSIQQDNDLSGTVIETLKIQVNQLNKEKRVLNEQNKILEQNQQNYKEIEYINQQLQQELVSRSKQDKVIEELKQKYEIQKEQQEIKEQKISKLQEQLKQNTLNQQKECSKQVELEMLNEQLRQEIEDIQRIKHKEIHQLQQKINELSLQIDQFQQEKQETQRSSVHYQQSPRCLDSEFKSLLNENISGYYPEQTIQEFQQQIQQKEQILQQREILFEQKVKTLEAKIIREKDLNIQHLQITSQLQEENKKLKQEFDKLVDTNYQVNRIQAEKQQNMLLISVIECLNEKINQLYTQQKEQLKSDKKIQPQILQRNSISLWSAKQ